MKRSGKFYRKNEKEVMESLGLKATYNSGSGWIEKEDGQNDFIICQLKSTDAQSIKVNQKDIRILEHNASVAHKIPIFAIQFLNTGEVWLMAKPEDFTEVAEYINTGKVKTFIKEPADILVDVDIFTNKVVKIHDQNQDIICCVDEKEIDYTLPKKIKSSIQAREEYKKEQRKKYDKTKSAK